MSPFWILCNLWQVDWHGERVYKSCWNTCPQWQLNQHRVIALKCAGTVLAGQKERERRRGRREGVKNRGKQSLSECVVILTSLWHLRYTLLKFFGHRLLFSPTSCTTKCYFTIFNVTYCACSLTAELSEYALLNCLLFQALGKSNLIKWISSFAWFMSIKSFFISIWNNNSNNIIFYLFYNLFKVSSQENCNI